MNHGGGGRPGKGGRQVTEDEAELWRQLTHSVDRVRAKPRVAADGGIADALRSAPAAAPAAAQQAKRAQQRPPAAHSVRSAPAAPARQPPPPFAFDRRTLRQVAAGKVTLDDVLDLHGLHQDAAQARLRAFLVRSQAKGHRMVLVITGKGGGAGVGPLAPDLQSYRDADGERSDPGRRGVLRRSVPRWLDEPELRAVVVSYASAGVRHGGDGALYVRLRKARDA